MAGTKDPLTAARGEGRLTGKTALVTGGSRGIGRAISQRLAADGARVGVHYGSREDAAQETVAAIESEGGSAFPVPGPLGGPGDAEQVWAAFDAQAQGVDILVNNAGVTRNRRPLGEIDEAEYEETFAVNVRAPLFLTQLALSRLRDGGRVINISTALTRGQWLPELLTYTMSKGALDVLTVTLAKQLGARGITVNAVAPGVVDTDMNASWLRQAPEARQAAAALSTLGRVGQPEDIARIVAFLASSDGGWITGQWLDGSGGALL